MAKPWLFHHNWAMRVSECLVFCKNPTKANEKYEVVFRFLGGQTYSVEFDDKKARDAHFRFMIRMMSQNYKKPIYDTMTILFWCAIGCLGTILYFNFI